MKTIHTRLGVAEEFGEIHDDSEQKTGQAWAAFHLLNQSVTSSSALCKYVSISLDSTQRLFSYLSPARIRFDVVGNLCQRLVDLGGVLVLKTMVSSSARQVAERCADLEEILDHSILFLGDQRPKRALFENQSVSKETSSNAPE